MTGSRQTTCFPLSLLVFLAFAVSPVRPQDASATPPQTDPKVVEAFQKWEETYRKIQKLECQIAFTQYDKTFDTTEKSTATLKIIKTNDGNKNKDRAMMSLKKQNLYVEKTNTDTTLIFCLIEQNPKYKYNQSLKELSLSIKNRNKDNISLFDSFSLSMDYENEFFLSLFFDHKIFLAKYAVNPNKEDDHNYYFNISPLNPKDQYAIKNTNFILSKSNGLPKKLFRKEKNGNEFHVDIKSINLNPILELKDVLPPDTEKIETLKLEDYFKYK